MHFMHWLFSWYNVCGDNMREFYDSFKGNKIKLVFGSLLKTIEAIFELLIPLYIANIINNGIIFGDRDVLFRSIIIMIIFYLCGYICSIISQYFSSLVASRVGNNIRNKIFSKVMNLSQVEMDKFDSKYINNSITNDVKQLENGINMVMRIGLRAPIVAIGSIIMAMTINFKLSIIFIISTVIVFFFLYFFLSYLSKCYIKIQSYKDKLNLIISEMVDGSRVIRSFNEQERENNKGIKASSRIFDLGVFVEYLQSLFNPVTYLIINVSLLIILYISKSLVVDKILFSGDVVALINYLTQTFVAVSALVNLVFIFSKAVASFSRIKTLFDYEVIVDEREDIKITSITSLEFSLVDFAYSKNKRVLEDVSFKIDKNMTLGIIGLTGSGKSTLSKLILNLYKCSDGEILINSTNINSISKDSLRDNISFVMQKPNLFSGTIRDNFKITNPNISLKEINKCLKFSKAYDFVYSFPKGIDTVLVENSRNLSGGQKQRLAIAIALAKNPALLILDDSSCALDLKTERELYSNLKNISSMKIIISQRVSTMRMCDKVLVLENGKVIGFDTYNNLLLNNKVFKNIVLSQEEVDNND